jgi:hypothetical protein
MQNFDDVGVGDQVEERDEFQASSTSDLIAQHLSIILPKKASKKEK